MQKAFFAFLLLPIIFSSCSPNNVTIDNSLKNYFDSAGVSGSFGLFDNGQGHFTIYNLSRYRDSAYLPSSTFDIVASLIGIQTGVIKDDSAVIRSADPKVDTLLPPASDVHKRTTGSGNKDAALADCAYPLSLKEAFQYSCVLAFGQLARQIGTDTLKKWIDSLGYGNKEIGSPGDFFWLDSHLMITSDEQLGLVKKLYFDQLPFFLRTQRIVRGMMLKEDDANYRLSYVTGSGIARNGHSISWITGWVEENKHPYFFVLNIESPGSRGDLRQAGMNILRSSLRQMGFFEGKK